MIDQILLLLIFATFGNCNQSSANFQCSAELISAKLALSKLTSEYDVFLLEYDEKTKELQEQMTNLQNNASMWTSQIGTLKSDNTKLRNSLDSLSATYNATELSISKLKKSIDTTQGEIAINVDMRTNLAYANQNLFSSLRILDASSDVLLGNLYDLSQNKMAVTSPDIEQKVSRLTLCQQSVTSTAKNIQHSMVNRMIAVGNNRWIQERVLAKELNYTNMQRQVSDLKQLCTPLDMTTISGSALTSFMIDLCKILDFDEIQTCRANVTAYEHNNTVILAEIYSIEESIDNKTNILNTYIEEKKTCDYDHGNCKAFLMEKQLIVENRRNKQVEDANQSVNIYHALRTSMKIHSEDMKFKEMTRIMMNFDDRVIYDFEADYILRLRTDIIQIYLLHSRTYLCNKLSHQCSTGHQCVLRPFSEMFLSEADSFTLSLIKTLESVDGLSARLYAKSWSLLEFSITSSSPDEEPMILPPTDLTKGYQLLPQHIIFQTNIIDLLDPDVSITRWLFEMENAFGIPSPSPQERFFINAMDSMLAGNDDVSRGALKYVKCECIYCNQVKPESF